MDHSPSLFHICSTSTSSQMDLPSHDFPCEQGESLSHCSTSAVHPPTPRLACPHMTHSLQTWLSTILIPIFNFTISNLTFYNFDNSNFRTSGAAYNAERRRSPAFGKCILPLETIVEAIGGAGIMQMKESSQGLSSGHHGEANSFACASKTMHPFATAPSTFPQAKQSPKAWKTQLLEASAWSRGGPGRARNQDSCWDDIPSFINKLQPSAHTCMCTPSSSRSSSRSSSSSWECSCLWCKALHVPHGTRLDVGRVP